MEWMLMPLRRYADFSGRSRRMEFWMWRLAGQMSCLRALLFILVFAMIGAALMTGDINDIGGCQRRAS